MNLLLATDHVTAKNANDAKVRQVGVLGVLGGFVDDEDRTTAEPRPTGARPA